MILQLFLAHRHLLRKAGKFLSLKMVYLVSQPYVPHSFPSTMWQTLQQLTQSCYFAITLYKVHLKQTLFLNTERIPNLFSLPLFYTPFSPLLLILCNWNQVFKNGWILHRSLKADSFGGVPIPQRPLISQLPCSNNPVWALSISFSIPLQFFFKKRLINSPTTSRPQCKCRAEKPFP